MAIVRIPEQGRTLKTRDAVTEYLAGINIEYQVWEPEHPTSPSAPAEEILQVYKKEIDALKARGGYVTADVINVTNRSNFVSPTGDRRSTNFLLLTTLYGGGQPRQAQVGIRFGF